MEREEFRVADEAIQQLRNKRSQDQLRLKDEFDGSKRVIVEGDDGDDGDAEQALVRDQEAAIRGRQDEIREREREIPAREVDVMEKEARLRAHSSDRGASAFESSFTSDSDLSNDHAMINCDIIDDNNTNDEDNIDNIGPVALDTGPRPQFNPAIPRRKINVHTPIVGRLSGLGRRSTSIKCGPWPISRADLDRVVGDPKSWTPGSTSVGRRHPPASQVELERAARRLDESKKEQENAPFADARSVVDQPLTRSKQNPLLERLPSVNLHGIRERLAMLLRPSQTSQIAQISLRLQVRTSPVVNQDLQLARVHLRFCCRNTINL